MVPVDSLRSQRLVVYMDSAADTAQWLEERIVVGEPDNQDHYIVEGHLAEDTGCKEVVGILDDRIVE